MVTYSPQGVIYVNAGQNIDIQIKSIEFVIERKSTPVWRVNSTTRGDYVLAYAQSGSAFYSIDGEDFHVKKGNVLFIKDGQIYRAKTDAENPWVFFGLGFAIETGDAETDKLISELPNVFRSSDSSQMAADFAELYRIWSAKSTGYLIKCRSLILDIIYMLLSDEFRRSKASVHYGKIESIVDMMRENCDKSYSLEELCTISGLSSSHFRMLFKEMTGLSVVQFQNRLRMDRAKDLILSGSCNVTEAASAVGFSNVYYFSRLFRKLTGKNPSEYLKS